MPTWNSRDITISELQPLQARVSALEDTGRKQYQRNFLLAALTPGAAARSLALPGFPTNVVVMAAYIRVAATMQSNNGATTTVTLQLGILGSLGLYLPAGANLMNVVAPYYPSHFDGSVVPGMRPADAPLLTVTTNGDVGHLTAFDVTVTVEHWLPVPV